jgi:hypothetical protein
MTSLDFATLACVFHAMRAGNDLHINGAVSRVLLRNLEEFQEAWALWRPSYNPISVTAASEFDDTPLPNRNGVFAFSGGVDSTFALLRHLDRSAGRRSCDPIAAVLVQGFDVPLDQPKTFRTVEASARAMLDSMGVPLVTVRTNWRSTICADWEAEFGAGLAACLHQFAGLASIGVVGSDEDYAHLVFPWGSNPATNPFLSSGSLAIRTEGGGITRTGRVQAIAKHPEIARRLHVCWEGQKTGHNCGRCEKCVRTKLNFMAAGLSLMCFDEPPSTKQIIEIRARNPMQIGYLKEIYSSARRNGIKSAWMNWLLLAIAKNTAAAGVRQFGWRAMNLLKAPTEL